MVVRVWGFGSRLELVCLLAHGDPCGLWVGGVSGVGLLFEIWIVDASIFVVCCVHCLPATCVGCALRVLCGFFRVGLLVPLVCGVGLVVCVTSCEGHMVDALASRADEGRRSLR